MNDFLKYTNPCWNEVLTEQESRIKLSCSGNSRKDKLLNYLKNKYTNKKCATIYDWQEEKSLLRREIALDFGVDSKIYKQLIRIEKYGHPKKCLAIKYITNLIIF